MENTTKLTKEELNKISLGYTWEPSMSYEQFLENNKGLEKAKTWDIFNLIDKRYCEYVYENE